MNISSVVLTPYDNTASDIPDDLAGKYRVPPGINFTSIEIVKLGLAQDVHQFEVTNLQGILWESSDEDPVRQALSYSLGSGLSCEVTRHELRETEVGDSKKLRIGQAVALKQYLSTNEEHTYFAEEHSARVLRLLRQELSVFCHPVLKEHPNIAQLHFIAWERTNLIPLLGLELAAFGTLDDFLSSADLTFKKHTITSWERSRATADITCSLQALHVCSLVHGDIKPSNILVQHHHGFGICFKLADFSGVRPCSGQKSIIDYEHHSTPAWMAPEVLSSNSILNCTKLDVYSYGLLMVTLWHERCLALGFPVECYLALHIPEEYKTGGLVRGWDQQKRVQDFAAGCEQSVKSIKSIAEVLKCFFKRRELGQKEWCHI